MSAVAEWRSAVTPEPARKTGPCERMRKARHWTTTRLAGLANVSPAALKRIERGQFAEVKLGVLIRVAASLGCSVLDLVPSLQIRGVAGFREVCGDEPLKVRAQSERQVADGSPTLARAVAWLREELSRGKVQRRNVEIAAHRAGISACALRRAKLHIGVRCSPDGRWGGPWSWSLPHESDVTERPALTWRDEPG